MRAFIRVAVCGAVSLLAAGCATETPQEAQRKAECSFPGSGRSTYRGILRDTVTMKVANMGKWCSIRVTIDDREMPGWNIVVPPKHGRADAASSKDASGLTIGYLPYPGYRGSDRFTIVLQPDGATYDFDIEVLPPPASRTFLAPPALPLG